MNDITVVMITMDRSPKRNYLGETIRNLERSGLWESSRLRRFILVDSGSPSVYQYLFNQMATKGLDVDTCIKPRVARENVARALFLGARTDADWVLFMEDDIDVCSDFLNSVGRWLDKHGVSTCHVFAFGAAYDQIRMAHKLRATAWGYPVEAFYGTQCFAIRPQDANSLAIWLETHRLVGGVDAPGAYDISMQEWARTNWPSVDHFMASVPNFVQHLGEESAIGNGFFQFPAWPGREWSYV